ncbi:hypothetical protein CEP52_007661 [Fusarium oligoseptatum]|uniref:Uncharacterized protein n=1 Tax=Fusarium oligoseptatum TaxID=2604345 RepID=A0A428TLT3_9HYPO|nr:hypothetical protein CEP52_007661 [Fusarium oligoseptatum]
MCPDYYDPQFTTFGNICQSVINDLPRSAMELVSKIMASLVTAVDGPYYAGLNESLLTIFESETSAQTARQLEFYKNFQRLVTSRTRPRSMKSRSKASVEGPRARRDAPNSESDHSGSENQSPTTLETINDEVECFRVIMDIRDELSMISSVFSEQEQVIQSVMNNIKKPIPPKGSDAHATRYADPTTDQLKGAEAQVVEKSLGHLLSLKLEVSNFALQVKADKQSSLLFAFTVVTVLYAPMSFVTSFFAIPSRDFPQDGGVSWNQRQIGGGLAISLVVTIVLVVLTVINKNEKDDKNGNDGKKSNKGKKTMEMSMA